MTARVSPSSQRAGVWIWCQGDPKPYHFYLYARRCFTLAQQPSRARLHVTASDRYVLYVNGAYMGRGPARSDPRRKSYDTYDVASRLRSRSKRHRGARLPLRRGGPGRRLALAER